ncbi:hydantoinase/oxoprolinase N-terminal domain-containing protein [Clostridium sp. 001]|uniref:hydantoinase/oxoprolinase N-terminal domain-containing protein n=1 Tax=Clostridium sp. 001 TaxID=1970093 RepID=UPI001C2CB3A8|nr:hydantoinase/oxoprolinase family protein [Clostridium sp. 001]QXE18040.1 hydantoinase subunit beta [Clostridium sp. 001]
MKYRIGIDVGGTNTDAVILDESLTPVAKIKTPTTLDVSSGIYRALLEVLRISNVPREDIKYAMLGTTHCTNAIVERKRLNKVGVIRIGLPATTAIKPMTGWPEDLKEAIGDFRYMVKGGFEFDGSEISTLDEEYLRKIAKEIKEKVNSIEVTSVFSPVSNEHEIKAAEIFKEEMPNVPVSLSSEIGSIGFLERENANILNASLVDVAETTVKGFIKALKNENINCQVYIGQNDGTLMSVDYAMKYPILTIACGPTNSLRGASYLAKQKNALVVDVGGTTTDIGVLINGFPRESSTAVEIGGVRTNFRMPDLVSIGLGGGTVIRKADNKVSIGPDSVGYKLIEKSLCFGGDTLTTSDIVTSLGIAKIGDNEKVKEVDSEMAKEVYEKIIDMAEGAIDRIKTNANDMKVVLVGGGSVLLPDKLAGASEVIRPDYFDVANAIGAAISQISGQVEKIFMLDKIGRDEAIEEAKNMAIEQAIKAGADPSSIEIVDIDDVPLAYIPGNATRIRVKAAGNLLK